MLPAQRRAIAVRAVAGVLVVIGAYLVAHALRSILHEQNVFLGGGSGMRHWEAARMAWARGDGFPLWDRTECGGTPSLGDPETPVLTSFFAALFQVSGDVMGRWWPTIAATLGVVGTYSWCRRALCLGRLGSFFAGVVFVANGFLALQTAFRMQYVPFFFIPWVLYFARLGEKDLRAAALTGAVLAFMILDGGFFPCVLACIGLLLVSVPRFAERDAGPLATSRMLGVAALAFLLVGGLKLYPMIVQMTRWPSHAKPTEGFKWSELMPLFLDKERFDGLAGHPFHYNEYRAYVGPFALGAAIAGAGVSVVLKPRRWSLAFLLLGGLLFTRGAYTPGAPYALLMETLRSNAFIVPSRFVVIAALGIAAAGGVAVDAALGFVGKHRLAAAVVLGVAFVAAWDPITEARKIMKAQGTEPWLSRSMASNKPFMIVDEGLGRVAEFPMRGVGSPACERLLDEPPASGFLSGERPQAWPESPSESTVANVNTKQNGYTFHVHASRPLAIFVDTSWDPDWTSNVGAIKRASNGLLQVVVPPGDSDIELRYRPRGFVVGLLATIVGLLGIALLAARSIFARKNKAKTKPVAITPTSTPQSPAVAA
jgi:hypothetical protein